MDIEIRNVSKAFEGKQVLFSFSARIPEGKFTSVMGPSGCGKTTLARLILGLEKPDQGRILHVPERISAVFQEDRLCEDFSVLRNVLLSSPGKKEKAMELLHRLGLKDELHTPVRELSGGMKRRTALARALLYSGDLLLLDEGFKGLDDEMKERAIALVKEEYAGKTVLSITHDEKEAIALGGQILRLGRPE